MRTKLSKVTLFSLAAVLILGLTGCNLKEDTKRASDTEGSKEVVNVSAEEEKLAKELLDRHVTEEDQITEGVIQAAIADLKETYKFEELEEIKIQSTDWAYVSQGKGWFEDLLGDNNTEVTVVEGSIGSEPQLMERGELHLANRMLYPYLLYKSQGADLTAVGISADPNPDIVTILVREDSDIQSFDDLKGKTIGSWSAGCQYVALLELTEERGWVEGKDWTYKNVSNDDIKTALQAGEIDAISVHPLVNFNGAIIDGSFREIANAKEGGTYVSTGGASVSFAPTSFANDYPNILSAVLKLRELVNGYTLLNQEEVAECVEGITRTPVENTIFYWNRSNETFFTAQDSLDNLISDTDKYQQWLIEHVEEFTEENKVEKEDFFDEGYIY